MEPHPDVVIDYNSGKILGMVRGYRKIEEEHNTKYLKTTDMILRRNACVSADCISPDYLKQINYKIFNTIYTLYNYSSILFEPVLIIIEYPEFHENKYNLNPPQINYTHKQPFIPNDYPFYKEQYDKLFKFLTENYKDFIRETGSPSESPAEIAIRLLEKKSK